MSQMSALQQNSSS